MKILQTEKEKQEFAKEVESNADFESQHPRGQPDNAGQFVKKGGENNTGQEQKQDDNIKPTNIKAVEEELYILREFGLKTGNEHATIMTEDGKILGNTEGTTDAVDISPMQRKLDSASPNSIILAHNHPNNSGFSPADLAIMCYNQSIKEMRVIGHDGNYYTMVVGNGRRPSLKEIEETASRIDDELEAAIGQLIRNGEITQEQGIQLHSIQKNELYAREYGWKYERGRIDDA